MELNEGYRWLSRPRAIDSKIRRLESKIEELRTCLEPNAIRYDVDKVNSSPDDMTSKIFAEIDEAERMCHELRLQKANIIFEITNGIENIHNESAKDVLNGFYIAKKRMPDIAEELNYELSWCYRLRRIGIEELEKE